MKCEEEVKGFKKHSEEVQRLKKENGKLNKWDKYFEDNISKDIFLDLMEKNDGLLAEKKNEWNSALKEAIKDLGFAIKKVGSDDIENGVKFQNIKDIIEGLMKK